MTRPQPDVPLGRIRPGQRLQVHVARTGGLLVRDLGLALSFGARLRGLLGRPALRPGQALLLLPCNAVHTFFMGNPIDVLMLDPAGEVVALHEALAPFRVTRPEDRALATLEGPPGMAAAQAIRPGDRLLFTPIIRA